MPMPRLLAAAALTLALAAPPSHAAFVNGGISFSNGFDSTDTLTSIVSQLNLVDVENPVQALGCSQDFGGVPCNPGYGAYANDFSLLDNGQFIFSWNGFDFVIDQFLDVEREALACDTSSQCTDRLSFIGVGQVIGNGFDPTGILLNWTAQGGCTMGAFPGECGSNVTASWSASITATGRTPILVAEPHGAALLGLAALLAGLVRRRVRA